MVDIEEKELELVFEPDEEDVVNDDYVDLSGQQIVTRPADPTIQSLFDMWKEGDIILQPKFQRKYVWNIAQASKLVESILLGCPWPVIYVSEDNDGKWIVIDGQQRLTSIFNFMDNTFEHQNGSKTEFKLSSLKVLAKYNKSKFADLEKEDQRKFKNYSHTILILKKSFSTPQAKNCYYIGATLKVDIRI